VNNHEIRATFTSGSERIGLRLTSLQMDQYCSYLSELVRWNKKMNLTGLRDTKEIIIKNFLDAMTPLCYLAPEKDSYWMDVGSGAGFPGLVLKIACPQLQISLVEPTQKKISFLHHVIGLLGLEDIVVFGMRIEQLAREKPCSAYDLILSRALAPETVLKHAQPLVREGGRFLFFAAKFDAIWWDKVVVLYPGLELEKAHISQLPLRGDARSLVSIRVSKTNL